MRWRTVGPDGVLIECENTNLIRTITSALGRDIGGDDALALDVVPASSTVLVVCARGRKLDVVTMLESIQDHVSDETHERRGRIEIPVAYTGPDLNDAAEEIGLTAAELVEMHSATRWESRFIGFAPGFAYLMAEGWPWSVSRLRTPRTRVPPGSVALAGHYCAIYPRVTPGGWRIIGQTQAVVWDESAEPPSLLVPGSQVRFVDVSRLEQ